MQAVQEAKVGTQIVEYDINTVAIAEMAKIYMDLTIANLESEDEFNEVHKARMVIKAHRVRLDKDVKKFNDSANAFKKTVKEKAKPLYDGLEPIETHLSTEEKKVTDEQKRIKEEEDRLEREYIQDKVDELQKYGKIVSFVDVAVLSDDAYGMILADAIFRYEGEQKRLAKEKEEREAEAKRLVDEREALEEKIRVQAAAQAKIDAANAEREAKIKAEQEKIEVKNWFMENERRREQERKDREAFEKETAEKAKMQAEKDAEERAEREKIEAEKAKEREAAELARKETLRPDKEKLIAYADKLLTVAEPELEIDTEYLLNWFSGELYNLVENLKNKIENF